MGLTLGVRFPLREGNVSSLLSYLVEYRAFFPREWNSRNVKLNNRYHLSAMELYFHFSSRLHGMVLN
jgi:hypothetical protein